MTSIAPVLEAFFTDRLARQRQASPHTVAAYRDSLCLLLRFVNDRTGKTPAKLEFTDLDATTIGAFLEHLELDRNNSVATRNSRLAALRSFFSYAALSCPQHAALIQRVLALPAKRTDRAIVCFLTHTEVDALLASPDRSTWIGRRDHALLVLAAQTGLRVSELTGLRILDVHLGAGAHVWCRGKGRKDRCTPLTAKTVSIITAWMRERGDEPDGPLFPSRHGPD
jgi:site-specific recombinase XerD